MTFTYIRRYRGTDEYLGTVELRRQEDFDALLAAWNRTSLDTRGRPVFHYRDARCIVGGYFEDETGWWQVEHDNSGGTGGSVWLVGRDGQERSIAVEDLPPLTYLEEHCNHPGGCYKPALPF
jgi:hypothetical protein